jgi:hypothetical protein
MLRLDNLDDISGITEKIDCLVHLAFYAIGAADEQRLMSISLAMIHDYVCKLRETVSHLQEDPR